MPYRNLSATELVRACVGSADPDIWNEFVARFQPTIAGVALRTTRRWGENSPLLVEDLIQETFLKLCAENLKLLRDFEPRHKDAFFSYLKVVTGSVAMDYLKKMRANKREPGSPMLELQHGELAADSSGSEQIEREALVGEIERRLNRLPLGPTAERDQDIFWLYYRAGMSAKAIAAMSGINLSVKGVESTIFRLTRLVRADLAGTGPEGAFEEDGESMEGAEKGNAAKRRLE